MGEPVTRLGDLVVDGLAAYRLARFVVDDTIIDEPRERLFRWLDPPVERCSNGVGQIVATFGDDPPFPGSRKLVEGLGCYWCVGVWIAGAVVALRRTTPRAWSPVADTLAVAAVAGLVAEQT